MDTLIIGTLNYKRKIIHKHFSKGKSYRVLISVHVLQKSQLQNTKFMGFFCFAFSEHFFSGSSLALESNSVEFGTFYDHGIA